MLESMEGRRGMPRLRPPFPAQSGYLGRPTLINNVETLAHVARILRGEWTPARLWSVSGAVREPGCYEAPLDVTHAAADRRLRRRRDRGDRRDRPRRRGERDPAAGRARRAAHARGARASGAAAPGSAARAGLPGVATRRCACSPRRCASSPRSRARSARRAGSATARCTTSSRSSSTGDAAMTARAGRRVARGDGADLDLRPRPGRADPGAERLPALAGAVRGARERWSRMVEFTLDGREASAPEGELLVHAARAARRLHPDALPRRQARPVRRLPDVRRRRRGLAAAAAGLRDPRRRGDGRLDELERAAVPEDADRDAPRRAPERDPGGRPNELTDLADELGAEAPFVLPDAKREPYEDRNRLMGYDPDACILCNRCVRYTQEVMQCSALSLEGRGAGGAHRPDVGHVAGSTPSASSAAAASRSARPARSTRSSSRARRRPRARAREDEDDVHVLRRRLPDRPQRRPGDEADRQGHLGARATSRTRATSASRAASPSTSSTTRTG